MEEYNDDNEIIGAHDAEWHRSELERIGKERAERKGFNEGHEKGMKQGIEQGIEQRNIEIVKNMLKENIPLNTISSVTGISIDKIKQLVE